MTDRPYKRFVFTVIFCTVAFLFAFHDHLAFSASAKGESDSVLARLERLEDKLREIGVRVLDMRKRKKELDLKLAESKEAAREGREKIGKRQALMARRMKAAYKMSSAENWEYLLGAKDFSDFVLRRYYLSRLWSRDRELIEQYGLRVGEVLDKKKRMEIRSRELDELMKNLEAEESRLIRRVDEKKRFVESIKGDKSLMDKARAEMVEAGKKLDRHVTKLSGPAGEKEERGERARAKTKAFSIPGKRYACPASGRVELGFGVKGREKALRFHGGYDIRASAGSPVRAPVAGRIVFSGRLRGFGNLAIIAHGGKHHTLYGHLTENLLSVGSDVEAGEILGHVGDTGSLKGAYLYFELRKEGKPVNPGKWFRCK